MLMLFLTVALVHIIACDSRCIGCEYAAVDRLPVLLQRLSRFLLSP